MKCKICHAEIKDGQKIVQVSAGKVVLVPGKDMIDYIDGQGIDKDNLLCKNCASPARIIRLLKASKEVRP